MKNIIFIAAPSAGKGTQSALLVEKYGYEHISTGDLLRAEAKKDTPLGHDINYKLKEGMLISDDLVNELVKNKIDTVDGLFILDGFPRTLEQAKYFDEISDREYMVLNLVIDKEEAMKRALGRATCEECNAIYNIYYENMTPKVEGKCDDCNGPLMLRSDDNKEAFVKRFESFETNTLPLIDYYKEKDLVTNVEVKDHKHETFESIESVIK